MRKRRALKRSRAKLVLTADTQQVAYFGYLQSSPKWREWVFRRISQRKAEGLVTRGDAQRVHRMVDGFVRVVGYRATHPVYQRKASPTTLTFATMMAVASDEPEAKLERWERNEVLKFRVWPLIGDTRAVAVRPRISAEERRHAERLLAEGGRPRPAAATAESSGILSAA